ncbi:MAG: hypothetical protein SAK29_20780 [Scytonema sp. PMC 1069.18]|nr:hypothetical protein [Scytonema sp. PMC 1069.18]MEC4886845.1 hypothetical protein [Scytonema sp. PMC 1070.18]
MTRILQERKASTINVLTIFAILTFGLHIVAIAFLLFQGLILREEVSDRKPLTLTQLVNGKEAPQPKPLERDPLVIRQFVSETMTAMFNWTGTLPPTTIEDVTNPKPDAGVSIRTAQGGTEKVATSSWIASFAISQDFRKGFLEIIADMTPAEVFSNSENRGLEASLSIQRIYPPEQIAPGRWRVGMVANIIQKRRNDNRKLITPFNKDFLVRAVDYFEHPLPNSMSDLQKAVYGVRAQGLEIYEVSDLCLTDPYDSSNTQLNRCQTPVNSSPFTQ